MRGYTISFAGETAGDCGLAVARRPDIPSPERRYEEITISGRDGKLYITDGGIEDIEIEVEMNFKGKPDEWSERLRRARRWLTGSGKLKFSDDPDFFYRVKKVTAGTAERSCVPAGTLKAVFTCEGYSYAEAGDLPYDPEDASYNPYDTCHPIYVITGEGACVLTVNGNTMNANIGQNLTIDTERMITYRNGGQLENTKVTGDYAGLFLKPGENAIQISENFKLKVIPNWRTL